MTQLFSLALLLGILSVLPPPAVAQAPGGATARQDATLDILSLGASLMRAGQTEKAREKFKEGEIDKLLNELPR